MKITNNELKNAVFGFKAFIKDLETNQIYCRDKVYYPGKINFQSGDISPCHNGIHFCKDIEDVRTYYSLENYRVVVYPVAAVGKVIEAGDKCVTNGLYIYDIPLDKDIINSYAKNNGLRFEIDGITYQYPFNACDKYFFNNHSNQRITYCGFNIKLGDINQFFTILSNMDYNDKRMIEFYFNETGKYKSGEKFIEVYTKDRIVYANEKHVKQLIDRMPLEMTKKAVKKYSVFYNQLGLFKVDGSCDQWYYIDELNRF